MKLGLGTVQFGLQYGISNRAGKTQPAEVIRILEVAAQNDIRIIDTAALYGTSEHVLGMTLPDAYAFDIVTKTPRFAKPVITSAMADLMERTFHQSLRNMRRTSLYGLLIHHADDLLTEGGHLLFEKMRNLKQEGLVRKIGVSAYTAAQIDGILASFGIDLIQVPVSVLDQRLIASGHLAKLKEAGVEVHARSAFLQGLLLMDPSTLPRYFEPVRKHLTRYHENIKRIGLTAVRAALGFSVGLNEIDTVICGVNDHIQLEELCGNANPVSPDLFSSFAIDDETIVNPALWKCD